MNKKVFKQLCMNYNKEPDKELYELWEYNLRCYDEKEMIDTVNFIITNDKYFPTLKRVLEVVKNIVDKENELVSEKQKIEKMKRLNIIPEWLEE